MFKAKAQILNNAKRNDTLTIYKAILIILVVSDHKDLRIFEILPFYSFYANFLILGIF